MRNGFLVVVAVLCCFTFVRAHPSCASNGFCLAEPSATFDELIKQFHVLTNGEFMVESQGRQRREVDWEKFEKSSYACTACEAGVNLIQYYLSQNKSNEEIIQFMEDFCTGTKYKTPKQCHELANLLGPEIIDILLNATIEPADVCSFVQNTQCSSGTPPSHQWTVDLPPIPKPPVEPPKPPNADTPKLKVLHISDTHYDPHYKEGTRDICPDPMCCREDNGYPNENETAAGKWGGWKCDIPRITLENMLDHIVATHQDIDYILWTGDLPPHDTWRQTMEDSIYSLNQTVALVHKYFPDTPIYPALGNHEPSPPHNFPPPILGNQQVIAWFYNELVKNWALFLPNSTYKTIEEAGYYVAQARPGLKIISLNTNFCYYNNWWLILNSTDPADQLKWFMGELQLAETNDEKVHVIAHIPPGYIDCLKIWGESYYKIVSRYESTITAQFFGHTHTDEIELYYDVLDTSRPVSIAYVAPAVSTHVYMNPGYRVYSVDGDHDGSDRYVYDFETWVMNLTEANLNDNPVWYKMYSAKDAYNLTSLLPQDWNDFYERLKTDDELLESYDRHYWKDSPKRNTCDTNCRRTRLCDIRSCVHYGEPV